MQPAGHLSAIVLETEREKLSFVVSWEREQLSMNHFNVCAT